MEIIRTCELCGGPIDLHTAKYRAKHGQRALCCSCFAAERAAERAAARAELKERFAQRRCVVCGGAIPWKDLYFLKKESRWPITCCPKCHGVQSKRDVVLTKEEVEDAICAYIKEIGRPVSYREVVRKLHMASKVWCRLGVSVLALNKRVLGYQVDRFSYSEVPTIAAETLEELNSAFSTQATSYSDLFATLRKQRASTAELERVVVSYVAAQGHYTGTVAIMKGLGVSHDYVKGTLRLDVRGINMSLGFVDRRKSWYEYEALAVLHRLFGTAEVSPEHTFADCRSVKNFPLRFDFFVPSKNLLLEIDGEQHTDTNSGFHTAILEQNDAIKTSYALEHGYTLIRVSTTPRFTFTERLEQAVLGIVKPVELLEPDRPTKLKKRMDFSFF